MLTLSRWLLNAALALFLIGGFVFVAAGLVHLFTGLSFGNSALTTAALVGSLSMISSLLLGLIGLLVEQIHEGRFSLKPPKERK